MSSAASTEREPICSPFQPRRWLRGGHVQTIASLLLPRGIQLPSPEERLVEVEPGIKVRCWCYWQAQPEDALTLIVVHGLDLYAVVRHDLQAGWIGKFQGDKVSKFQG